MSDTDRVDRAPLVSIGVPIFNEAPFIEQTLNSLLSQTYENCEILISDNASTDGTTAMCENFAQIDKRITYRRLETNIGAAANFQNVLEMASGRYFMWAGGHDLWSENLVAECVNKLETLPKAVLAFATSNWIDETGRSFDRQSGYSDTRGLGPIARFFTVFWGNMHPILGLIRLDCLRRASGFQSFAGTDLVLLSELVLMGDFIHASEAHWSRRQVRVEESHRQRLRRYSDRDYGLAKTRLDRLLPLFRLPLGLTAVVWSAKIPLLDRLSILAALLPALPIRYLAGRR